PKQFFPPMPADKVAVGYLVGDVEPTEVTQSMDYIITGKAPAGTRYKLLKPGGYPGMIGAMFWTIDADRRANYIFSNSVGPLLHGYPSAK
ncbi:MAG TPA: glycoside hydrolase, partial [Edaphobacter sp.]|nr:glycoside hydrolase [Edaphobacter sp.]